MIGFSPVVYFEYKSNLSRLNKKIRYDRFSYFEIMPVFSTMVKLLFYYVKHPINDNIFINYAFSLFIN